MKKPDFAAVLPGAALAGLLGFGLAYTYSPRSSGKLGPLSLSPVNSTVPSLNSTQTRNPAASSATAGPAPSGQFTPPASDMTSGLPDSAGESKPAGTHKAAPPLASISLNDADAGTLMTIPSVGPTLAQAIIEFRGRLGGFTSLDQLKYVKGIGEKRLEKIKPYLRIQPRS